MNFLRGCGISEHVCIIEGNGMPTTQAAKPAHAAKFHIHAAGGVCPVCYVSEASTWEDLYERLEKAKHIVATTMELEQDVALSKIRTMSKV